MSMDISPMNLQLMVPRSTEVSQTQHNINQHFAMQEDFSAAKEKMDAELKQKQVRERDGSEDGRIKDDPDRQKRQGGWGGSRHRRQNSSEDAAPEKLAIDLVRGQNLDISF